MKNLISAIQRMSVHDGPGIRSTVFLKGCNMRCRWCHNPETWCRHTELQHVSSKCASCGTCISVCPETALGLEDGVMHIDRKLCSACGLCADRCPQEAMRIVGREMTVDEVFEEVQKDRVFFDVSSGGVTVSGGEPFVQADFTAGLLQKCRRAGIHTVVQTSMAVSWELIRDAVPYVDLWMCDMKCYDSDLHRQWTGVGNSLVKENIRRLIDSGVDVIVRTPIIPGFNDNEREIYEICRFLTAGRRPSGYELMPFHDLGFEKYKGIGICNMMEGTRALPEDALDDLKKILYRYGF